jgi:hypothetical protein
LKWAESLPPRCALPSSLGTRSRTSLSGPTCFMTAPAPQSVQSPRPYRLGPRRDDTVGAGGEAGRRAEGFAVLSEAHGPQYIPVSGRYHGGVWLLCPVLRMSVCSLRGVDLETNCAVVQGATACTLFTCGTCTTLPVPTQPV